MALGGAPGADSGVGEHLQDNSWTLPVFYLVALGQEGVWDPPSARCNGYLASPLYAGTHFTENMFYMFLFCPHNLPQTRSKHSDAFQNQEGLDLPTSRPLQLCHPRFLGLKVHCGPLVRCAPKTGKPRCIFGLGPSSLPMVLNRK